MVMLDSSFELGELSKTLIRSTTGSPLRNFNFQGSEPSDGHRINIDMPVLRHERSDLAFDDGEIRDSHLT